MTSLVDNDVLLSNGVSVSSTEVQHDLVLYLSRSQDKILLSHKVRMQAGATVVRGSFLLDMLCLQLALMMAQSAHEIQKKSPGRFLVKQLLKLQAIKPSSVQVMQNVVCHVGESFEQNLVEIMVTPTQKLESLTLHIGFWLTVVSTLLPST